MSPTRDSLRVFARAWRISIKGIREDVSQPQGPGLAPLCDDDLSRGKEVEAPHENTFSAGIGGPEPVLAGRLRCSAVDASQQFHA